MASNSSNSEKVQLDEIKGKKLPQKFNYLKDKVAIVKLSKISIKIKHKKCLLCEECVKHCPAEALGRKNEKIVVDRDKCIECFCCGESCPHDAISAKFYLFRILPVILLVLAIGSFVIIWFLIQLITSF